MSDAFATIKAAAALEGYEVAHHQENYGERFMGVAILVKMSNRKLGEADSFYRVADEIAKQVDTVSAQLDPKGPATREAYRAEIAGIYQAAGVGAVYMESLPNGYCKDPCCLNRPWFRVTSSIGHIVIGWRKRVLSIDWKDSTVKATGEALFPGEDVTRWETGIHAWGAEKAAEYVRRLHA